MQNIKILAIILLFTYFYFLYISSTNILIMEKFAGLLPISNHDLDNHPDNNDETDIYHSGDSLPIIEEEQIALINNSNEIKKYKITVVDNNINNKKVNCFFMNKRNRKYMSLTGNIEDKIKIININNIYIGDIKHKLYNNYILNINDNNYDIYVSNNNNQINMDISDENNNNIVLYLIKDTENNDVEDKYNIYFNYKNIGVVNKTGNNIFIEILLEYKKYINFTGFMYILLVKINSY